MQPNRFTLVTFQKQIVKAYVAGIAIFVSTGASPAHAQSASASATAIVVSPLTVLKTADFNFGRVVPGGSAGTVVLSPAGSRSIGSGGTVLGNAAGSSAASFSVSGAESATFSIGISGGILSNGAGATMAMTNFVVRVAGGNDQTSSFSGTLSAAGSATFAVGGTLAVGTSANTPTGSYSTGNSGGQPVTVTVSYN